MARAVRPLARPKVLAAAAALPLMFLRHFVLHRYLVQACLVGHSRAEIQHLPLPCSVSPKLAFENLARSVARLVHSPRQAKCCQGQHSSCHSVHWARCLMRQHLDQVTDC